MKYTELKRKHQKEYHNFPMFFAFTQEQFRESVSKLGLTEKDTDKLLSIGCGGFIKKADRDAFKSLILSCEKEMKEAIASDKTGEGFIYEMFRHELANHEYCITYDVTDTLEATGLSQEDIDNNEALKHGLEKAIKDYLESND